MSPGPVSALGTKLNVTPPSVVRRLHHPKVSILWGNTNVKTGAEGHTRCASQELFAHLLSPRASDIKQGLRFASSKIHTEFQSLEGRKGDPGDSREKLKKLSRRLIDSDKREVIGPPERKQIITAPDLLTAGFMPNSKAEDSRLM